MATAKTARQPRRPARSERGGHTALTPALQKRIVANIKKGVHVNIAARAAGVSEPTFYRWLDLGSDKADPDSGETIVAPQPYREFREAIEDAEAALELDLVGRYRVVSRQAAFGNAGHLAGFLGRRFRQRWDPKQTVEVSGPGGGPVEVKGGDDVDRLAGVLGALARLGVVVDPGAAGGTPSEPEAPPD